jgi:hypothetical protein
MFPDAANPYPSPLLLSRRLVSSGSQVRPHLREFIPSDAEEYLEYRARIYETMCMALPLIQSHVVAVRNEIVATDQWGEGTVTVKPLERERKPIGIYVGPAFGGLKTERTFQHIGADGRVPDVSPVPLAKRSSRGSVLALRFNNRDQPERLGASNYPLEIQVHTDAILGGSPAMPVRPDEAEGLFLGIYFDETYFYPLWSGLSPLMHREMGRDWAKDPPVHIGDWPVIGEPLTQPPDIFLVPNGFRCAR